MHHSITLHLLGTPVLELADGTAIKLRQKSYAMAALLFLEFRDRTRRAMLAERIWETVEPEKALNSLRQTLLQTRRVADRHGFELFFSDGIDIELRHHVTLDLRELPGLRTVVQADELHRLIGLYRGRLLDSLTGFGPGFEAWRDAEQSSLERRFAADASEAAIRIGGQSGGDALQRLADLLPASEIVCRANVKYHLGRGDRDAARSAFEAFTARFPAGIGPVAATDMDELIQQAGRSTRAVPAAATTSWPTRALEPQRGNGSGAMVNPRVVLLPPAQDGDLLGLPRHLGPALVDDVSLGLSRLHSISVIAPFTARHLNPATVLDDLRLHQIDYAVESRITRDAVGDGVSLLIQLIRSDNLQIVWAEKFAFSPAAAPERYWDFTAAVVRTLADGIEGAEFQHRRRERNAESYGHYLAGRDILSTFDLPQIQRGRNFLQLARQIEPDQASVESALARSYVIEWVLRSGADRSLLDHAKQHAVQAVALDPADGTAHRELGLVSMYEHRMDESLVHMATAARLNPHNADVLADYADMLVHNSDHEAAEAKLAEAMRLNPLVPDSYLWTLGAIHFFLNRFDLALKTLQQMRNREPALRLMAAAAVKAERRDLATAFREQALLLQPDFSIDRWAAQIPQRDPADVALYVDALRQAGFP